MTFEYLDLTVARYPSLAMTNPEEMRQAAMVLIDEPVAEGIYHSTKLNWKGDLSFFERPEDFIRSDKERKDLEVSKAFFLSEGYEFKVCELTPELEQAFLTLYQETTLKKNRAIDFNAQLVIRKNQAGGVPVWVFGLYRDHQLESGLLVSQVKEDMMVLFGAKKRFDQVRGGVGGVLEMELLTFCFERGFKKISHGISTNPAGIVDSAGIFEFKSRYGFTAFPYGEWQTTFILNESVALSDIVFLTIKDSQLCHQILAKTETPSPSKYNTRFVKTSTVENLSDHIHQAHQVLGLL
jgi:hypothetical protein